MLEWLKEGTLHACTLFVTVAAMLLGAYFSLRSIEEAQQVQLAGIEARLVIAEHAITNRQEVDERFAAEMRTALNVITAGVSDLRVLEAKRVSK